jgi:hypothetical protein
MKTFVTVPIAVEPSRTIRQSRVVYYKTDAKRSLLKRFQHFIESTDWEERYLCNLWIDAMCLGGIVVSMIYFLPLLLSIIERSVIEPVHEKENPSYRHGRILRRC